MTGLPRSYGLVRPRAPHWYARLVVVATWTSPLASERQVPAGPHESPDQTRASSTPVAIRPRIQVSDGLIPEDREASGFDDRSLGHDASTEVQGSSPCLFLPARLGVACADRARPPGALLSGVRGAPKDTQGLGAAGGVAGPPLAARSGVCPN